MGRREWGVEGRPEPFTSTLLTGHYGWELRGTPARYFDPGSLPVLPGGPLNPSRLPSSPSYSHPSLVHRRQPLVRLPYPLSILPRQIRGFKVSSDPFGVTRSPLPPLRQWDGEE